MSARAHVPPEAEAVQGTYYKPSRCQYHVLGRASLQNHEPRETSLFCKLPNLRYFVMATGHGPRQQLNSILINWIGENMACIGIIQLYIWREFETLVLKSLLSKHI